jgi:hypothetical protein
MSYNGQMTGASKHYIKQGPSPDRRQPCSACCRHHRTDRSTQFWPGEAMIWHERRMTSALTVRPTRHSRCRPENGDVPLDLEGLQLRHDLHVQKTSVPNNGRGGSCLYTRTTSWSRVESKQRTVIRIVATVSVAASTTQFSNGALCPATVVDVIDSTSQSAKTRHRHQDDVFLAELHDLVETHARLRCEMAANQYLSRTRSTSRCLRGRPGAWSHHR